MAPFLQSLPDGWSLSTPPSIDTFNPPSPLSLPPRVLTVTVHNTALDAASVEFDIVLATPDSTLTPTTHCTDTCLVFDGASGVLVPQRLFPDFHHRTDSWAGFGKCPDRSTCVSDASYFASLRFSAAEAAAAAAATAAAATTTADASTTTAAADSAAADASTTAAAAATTTISHAFLARHEYPSCTSSVAAKFRKKLKSRYDMVESQDVAFTRVPYWRSDLSRLLPRVTATVTVDDGARALVTCVSATGCTAAPAAAAVASLLAATLPPRSVALFVSVFPAVLFDTTTTIKPFVRSDSFVAYTVNDRASARELIIVQPRLQSTGSKTVSFKFVASALETLFKKEAQLRLVVWGCDKNIPSLVLDSAVAQKSRGHPSLTVAAAVVVEGGAVSKLVTTTSLDDRPPGFFQDQDLMALTAGFGTDGVAFLAAETLLGLQLGRQLSFQLQAAAEDTPTLLAVPVDPVQDWKDKVKSRWYAKKDGAAWCRFEILVAGVGAAAKDVADAGLSVGWQLVVQLAHSTSQLYAFTNKRLDTTWVVSARRGTRDFLLEDLWVNPVVTNVRLVTPCLQFVRHFQGRLYTILMARQARLLLSAVLSSDDHAALPVWSVPVSDPALVGKMGSVFYKTNTTGAGIGMWCPSSDPFTSSLVLRFSANKPPWPPKLLHVKDDFSSVLSPHHRYSYGDSARHCCSQHGNRSVPWPRRRCSSGGAGMQPEGRTSDAVCVAAGPGPGRHRLPHGACSQTRVIFVQPVS